MLNDRKQRRRVVEVAFVVLLVSLAVLLAVSAHGSLERQEITSGFDFLFRSTGWDIGFRLIDYSISDPYWKVLVVGILNTLFLGSIGLLCATFIGILVGTARTAMNPVVSLIGTIYVESFRNVPLILQAFFWYALYTHLPPPRQAYEGAGFILSSRGIFMPGLDVTVAAGLAGLMVLVFGTVLALFLDRSNARLFSGLAPRRRRLLAWGSFATAIALSIVVLMAGHRTDGPLVVMPVLTGLNIKGGLRVPPEFAALLTAMALYGGAYIGEIVRAGFLAVSPGQIEAAQALGLRPWQIFSRIRLPLAIRAILPTLTNQYVWLLKATTLGIAVGFSDFFLIVSTAINQSGQTLELIALLMGGFLLINYSLGTVMNAINRTIAIKGNQART